MKNRVDYFPHDTNMSTEPEVIALMRNYGIEGYGLLCLIMELLGKSETFKLKIKTELEIECLSAACGLQSEKFSSIIAYMKRLDLVQVDDGELRCKRFEKSIEFLLEKREKERDRLAKKRADKNKDFGAEIEKSQQNEENRSKNEDVGATDAQSKVKYSKVKESKVNFLGGGGKQAHENQPTTDQKKNKIYEYEETKEFLGTNSDFLEKKEKSSAKKEKEAGQDEQGEGKNEKKGKIKGTEKGQAEKGKISHILKEIENSVYIISDFSHSLAPHWERWVKHLEKKQVVLSSEMQEFQQREFIKRANEQGISVKDLENLLILEIAATIQNQDKTDKKLVALNPFFHKKVVENEKPNSSKRKYRFSYNTDS